MTIGYESRSSGGHGLIGALATYVRAKLSAIGNCIPMPNAEVRELDDRSLAVGARRHLLMPP